MNWFFLLVYLFPRFRLTPISPLPVLPDLVDLAGDPAKQDVDISNDKRFFMPMSHLELRLTTQQKYKK